MTIDKTLKTLISISCVMMFVTFGFSQTGAIVINQDKDIEELISLKKEIGETSFGRYKIQIYSGKRGIAEGALAKFRETYSGTYARLIYETPNYKVWAGNYRTRLEADRALLKLKGLFPSSFIFKPKK